MLKSYSESDLTLNFISLRIKPWTPEKKCCVSSDELERSGKELKLKFTNQIIRQVKKPKELPTRKFTSKEETQTVLIRLRGEYAQECLERNRIYRIRRTPQTQYIPPVAFNIHLIG